MTSPSYYPTGRARSRYSLPSPSSGSFSDRRGSTGSYSLYGGYPAIYNYEWSVPYASKNSSTSNANNNSRYSSNEGSYGSLPRNTSKSTAGISKGFYQGTSSSTPSSAGYLLGHYTISPVITAPQNPTLAKYQKLKSSPNYRPYSFTSSTEYKPKSNFGSSINRAPSPELIQKRQSREKLEIQLQKPSPPSRCLRSSQESLASNISCDLKKNPGMSSERANKKGKLSLKQRLSSSLSSLVTSLSGSTSNLALSSSNPINRCSGEAFDSEEDVESCDFEEEFTDSVSRMDGFCDN